MTSHCPISNIKSGQHCQILFPTNNQTLSNFIFQYHETKIPRIRLIIFVIFIVSFACILQFQNHNEREISSLRGARYFSSEKYLWSVARPYACQCLNNPE